MPRNTRGSVGAVKGTPRKPEMTKSYIQLVKQIEALKVEAEKVRKTEVSGVIKRIRDAIAHYGLTAEDLGLVGGVTAKRAGKPAFPVNKRKAKAGAAPVVKFRNDAGMTWGGRGKRPQWLRDALAGGQQLSDFLVK